MSEQAYQEIIATFTPRQLAVLRVSIIAERHIRTHYQIDPEKAANGEGTLKLAYDWAREQVE